MKMAKKLLAVVLAGVLALSVLTGCGNTVSTKTIADVLSDMYKSWGITYKADPELNEKAKEIIDKAGLANQTALLAEDDEPSDSDVSLEDIVLTDDQCAAILKILGDGYADKYVEVSFVKTKGNNVTTQAAGLLMNSQNITDYEYDYYEHGGTLRIGTTTFTWKETSYRFAVIVGDVEVEKN